MHLVLIPARRGRRLLLLAGAVLLAAAITPCRMVTDNVVRPQPSTTATSDCIQACARAANEAIRVESEQHVKNVHACGTDTTCLALEDTRHVAAVAVIQAQRKVCQNRCHHQGGGGGGR